MVADDAAGTAKTCLDAGVFKISRFGASSFSEPLPESSWVSESELDGSNSLSLAEKSCSLSESSSYSRCLCFVKSKIEKFINSKPLIQQKLLTLLNFITNMSWSFAQHGQRLSSRSWRSRKH